MVGKIGLGDWPFTTGEEREDPLRVARPLSAPNEEPGEAGRAVEIEGSQESWEPSPRPSPNRMGVGGRCVGNLCFVGEQSGYAYI